MKKLLLGVVVVLLLVVGVFAAQEVSPAVSEIVGNVASGLGVDVSGYVQDFVKKRGVLPENIENITQVDFNALPKEVNIENVGDHNLVIYQVDYDTGSGTDQVYVITYSVNELKAQGDLIIAHDKRQFLNFGASGTRIGSGFIETSTGVTTALDKGYVMVRDGSITAVSTNLEIFENSAGSLEIIIYKNGEKVSFGNTFSTEISGVKKDYDVQARDTVTFNAGDVVSVYVLSGEGVVWGDVTTMVEITTIN